MTNQVVHPSPRAQRFGMENHPRGPGDHKRSPTQRMNLGFCRMTNRSLEHSTRLVWSQNGIPHQRISPEARIHLTVHSAESKTEADPSLPPQIGTVAIRGNRAGLVALAEQLLAIAHTDIEGYHQHFDSDVPHDFLDANGNWELIVERNDQRAIRQANQKQ